MVNTNKLILLRRLSVVFVLAFVLCNSKAKADNYIWTGADAPNNAWEDGANWTNIFGGTGSYPGDGVGSSGADIAEVGSTGHTNDPVLSSPISLAGLMVDQGSILTISISSLFVSGTLVVNGELSPDNSSTVSGGTLNTTATAGTGNIDVVISGSGSGDDLTTQYDFTTLLDVSAITVNYEGGSQQLIGADAGFYSIVNANGSGLQINSGITVNGPFVNNWEIIPSGTAVIAGTGTLTGNGTIDVTGSFLGADDLKSQYTLNVDLSGGMSVTYNGTAPQVIGTVQTFNNVLIGSMAVVTLNTSLASGTYDVEGELSPASLISLGGTSLFGGGQIDVTATGSVSGDDLSTQYAVASLIVNALTVNYNGGSGQAIGAFDPGFLNINVASGSSVTANIDLSTLGSLTGAGHFTIAGSHILSLFGNMTVSSFTANSSTVNFIGQAITTQTIGQAYTFNSLEVSSASSAQLDGTHTITVNGNLDVDDGGSQFSTNGSNIIVAGSVTGGGTLNFNANEQLTVGGDFNISSLSVPPAGLHHDAIILNGTSTQTISNSNYTFDNLEIDNIVTGVNIDAGLSNIIIQSNLSGTGTLHAGVVPISLYGDMTINTLDVSAGHVLFLNSQFGFSAAVQHINAQTLYGVLIANANTILTGPVTINTSIDFLNGNLELGNNKLTLATGSSTTWNGSATPDPSSGYVVTNGSGMLEMTTVSGSNIFPVGDSYNPLTITDGTGGNVFDVSVANGVTGSTKIPATDWAVARTWQIISVGGASVTVAPQWDETADLAGPDFDLTKTFLSYRDTTHTFVWTAGTATDISGFSNPYTITSSTIAFAPGDVYNVGVGSSTASPLPVSLLNFTAQYQNGKVNLNWQTASEQNNDYFVVERSADTKNWTNIGQVQGHGTSNVMNSYADNDNLAGIIPSGIFYYRLKQVDYNGNYAYAPIRTVDISNPGLSVSAYPNPTNSALNINWVNNNNDNSEAVIKLSDINGTTVYQQAVSGTGHMSNSINMNNMTAGVYYLQVYTGNGNVWSQAVVKN